MEKYEFKNKTLYFAKEKIMVIGDLHFGYEEELNNLGIGIPFRMLEKIKEEIFGIAKSVGKIEKIVILGDLRHSFGKILKKEREEINEFINFLELHFPNREIVITKGNHDTMVDIIFNLENWKNVKIVDYFLYKKILFFHGDCKSFEKIERIWENCELVIVGHFHPAIDITDGEKVERYKCFLEGTLAKKKIIICPSFFPFIDGANILGDCEVNYYDIRDKKISVVDSEGTVYNFGKIE